MMVRRFHAISTGMTLMCLLAHAAVAESAPAPGADGQERPGSGTLTPERLAQESPSQSGRATSGVGATVQAPKSQSWKQLLGILGKSGLDFQKNADGSWVMDFKGHNRPLVRVHVSAYEDLALVQSTAVESIALTAARMEALLILNFEQDLVKVSLKSGDLVVLNETEIRTMDGRQFKRIVEAVALLADDLAADSVADETFSPLSGPPQGRQMESIPLLSGYATLGYDASQWRSVAAPTADGYQSQNFQHANGEVFFRVVTERSELPLTSMPEIALTNAKTADPNAKVVRKGWRTVNGARVLVLQIDATYGGVPIVFLGHYYSDKAGTIQVVGWFTRNLLDQHRGTIDSVVSGFQIRR